MPDIRIESGAHIFLDDNGDFLGPNFPLFLIAVRELEPLFTRSSRKLPKSWAIEDRGLFLLEPCFRRFIRTFHSTRSNVFLEDLIPESEVAPFDQYLTKNALRFANRHDQPDLPRLLHDLIGQGLDPFDPAGSEPIVRPRFEFGSDVSFIGESLPLFRQAVRAFPSLFNSPPKTIGPFWALEDRALAILAPQLELAIEAFYEQESDQPLAKLLPSRKLADLDQRVAKRVLGAAMSRKLPRALEISMGLVRQGLTIDSPPSAGSIPTGRGGGPEEP